LFLAVRSGAAVLGVLVGLRATVAPLPVPAQVEGCAWEQVAELPIAIYDAAGTVDPTDRSLYVHGGVDRDGAVRDELYRLDLRPSRPTVERVTTSGAEVPRWGHSLTFVADGPRGLLYAVGGGTERSDNAPAESRVFAFRPDTGRWQSAPVAGMPALQDHAAAYDPVHGVIAVHGGRPHSGQGDVAQPREETYFLAVLEDRLIAGPRDGPKLYSHSMVWDPQGQRMLVFGGTADGQKGVNTVHTLELHSGPGLAEWTTLEVSGTPPVGRFNHGAAFDTDRRAMIVYGGMKVLGEPLMDTWALDLSTAGRAVWRNLDLAVAKRSGQVMVYDPFQRVTLQISGGRPFSPEASKDVFALRCAGAGPTNPPPGTVVLPPTGTPPGGTVVLPTPGTPTPTGTRPTATQTPPGGSPGTPPSPTAPGPGTVLPPPVTVGPGTPAWTGTPTPTTGPGTDLPPPATAGPGTPTWTATPTATTGAGTDLPPPSTAGAGTPAWTATPAGTGTPPATPGPGTPTWTATATTTDAPPMPSPDGSPTPATGTATRVRAGTSVATATRTKAATATGTTAATDRTTSTPLASRPPGLDHVVWLPFAYANRPRATPTVPLRATATPAPPTATSPAPTATRTPFAPSATPARTPTPSPVTPPTPTSPPPATQTPLPCIAEEVEPNNALLEALDRPELCRDRWATGALPPGDDSDHWRMEVAAPGLIQADLRNIPAGMNYDLYIYRRQGQLLALSQRPGTEPEHVEARVDAAGDYYLRVYPSVGRGTESYEVRWGWAP